MKRKNMGYTGLAVFVLIFAALFVTACPGPDKTESVADVFTVTKAADFDNTYGDFSVNPASAQKGDEITLTITAIDDNYIVDQVIIGGVTPSPAVTTVAADVQYSFVMPAKNVTVKITFKKDNGTGPGPSDDYTDYAYGRGAYAAASKIRTTSPATPIDNAFDDNWDTFAQIEGAVAAHWFAVDLGEAKDIRTVRIVWGLANGASGDFNGMVNYQVQTSTSTTLVPGDYTDTDWFPVKTVNNPGNDGVNVRNDQQRVNTIVFDQAVLARYVRIKQIPGLDASAAPAADRPWTNWPSVASFEVYLSADVPQLIQISQKTIASAAAPVPTPVWRADAPAISTDYAPENSHYTAKLTAITPAPAGGKFAPATEYTYEFTLDAQTGYNFATAAPTIFVSDPAAAQTTIIKSQNADKTQIVATYTFLATETNIISDVAFIAGLKQPVSGENAPSSANFAEEDAHYTAALAIQQSSNGTSWAAMSGSGFVTDMFYKYIFTATAKTDYLFAGGTVTAPVIDLVPAVISGNGTGVLTLTYTFEKTGGLVSISAGTITVTEPAAGQPAQALDTGNLAGASDNFTAQLHSYGGALNGANYSAAAAYTFVFALTPKTNYKFTDSAAINITVNGNAGVYAYISDTSATVSYAWPSLAYPEDNRAINLAYNRGAYATGSATNTNSAYANAFDGDITTNWQATNTGTQWLEVDLGNNYDIGTVRIYFNAANGTNIFNDGAVWVATGDTLPVIDSTDWTNVGSFECANNATSVTVTVPNGTSARYVRVMALTASTATTNYWVRVTELEVYSAGPATTAAIGAKAVTGITAPVALETPPAIGTAYTTNDVNFTAELTGIEGALGTDNNFDYDTAYAYDIKLIANPGYHFTTVLPSINGTNVIAADLISNNGYEMVVRRTFAKTGLAPVVGGHTVSFANGGIVNDSANSGLTATATTAQSEFNAGQTVTVTVKVTGTSKRAAIYEAKLSNDKGLTINFVPGIIGTSSNVPKRNIGGIGAFSATTQENLLTTDINGIVSGSAEATGEVIGSAFAGTPGITTQPAEDWTFNMAFTMPDDNVTLTLTNTFMTDIVPAIVAKAVDPVNGIPAYGTDTAPYKSAFADNVVKGSKWSNDTGLHTPLKAFNGQYNHHTNGWDNRWELTTDPANQWVALNLGNNYDISDIVLRFRNSGIGERQYRIYVSNDDSVWDELSATPTTSATSGTPLSYAAVDANSKWTKGWEVNSTDPITNNNYCYHPLFLGADNTILRDLGSNGANGIGPYRGVDSYWTNNGSGHIVTTPNSPIEAKYVLLVIQSGVQASATINNFEIYGTPVQP